MPTFKTYNHTNQPMWVTIYTVGGVFKEDWGNVDPGTYREWNSGNYAIGSFYKVRAQWPTTNSKWDTDTTVRYPKELVLLGGDPGVYWSSPVVRTDNALNVPAWITIYTEPGEVKKDYGDVEAGASRDWAAGDYTGGTILTLLAEWDSSVTVQNRVQQAAPPQEKSSVKISHMFDPDGNGIAHFRLESDGKEVVWTYVT